MDDTKLAKKINDDKDREDLQNCLDLLCSWANNWGMEFNIKKCKVLHTGRNNPLYHYTMNGVPLTVVEQEKDIGVTIHKSLKPSPHCADIARKANIDLGQISRSFHYIERNRFI